MAEEEDDFPGPILEDAAIPERSKDAPDGVLNNLIEMDTELFEELVAGAMERKVRHDQIWLIFFDSPTCKGCPFVYQTFLDLSNVQELVSVFKLGHVVCGRATAVCHRLGIKGFPTISVLAGGRIYDY